MPTRIETSLETAIIDVPEVKVYVADALVESQFTATDPDTGDETALVEFLWLDRLRMTVAPEIDVAEFTYEYGRILRQGASEFELVEPLDVTDKFVKVVIGKTLDTDKEITWYGRFKFAQTNAAGGGLDGESPCGTQKLIAYGLLHLLNEKVIETSKIDDGEGGTITINTGLPFNLDPGGVYPATGNRSSSTIPRTDGTYVFSKEPRSKDRWTADQAVEYLLQHHVPLNEDDEPAPKWEVGFGNKGREYLNWYDITVDCDLRTVKEVIDELINRRRGVGYYVEFVPGDPDDPNDEDAIYLYIFSFVSTDLELPSGQKLLANQKQRALDFEEAFDIVDSTITDVATNKAHSVRAFGEFMTSTFTNKLTTAPDEPDNDENMFVKGWTDEEEEAFNKAASVDDDGNPSDLYNEQPFDVQAAWNAMARNSDKFRHVFTRFLINPKWRARMVPPHDAVPDYFHAAPRIPDGEDEVDPVYNPDENPTGESLWLSGLRLLPYLPLKDIYDYSGAKIVEGTFDEDADEGQIPKSIPVMVYARVAGGAGIVVRDSDGDLVEDPPRFELVDRLHYSSFDPDRGRRWACSVACPSDGPIVEIHAHPPQMIARAEFDEGEAETADNHLPSENGGLYWQHDLFATLTMQIPRRVQSTVSIETALTDIPKTEIALYVPGARADYVVPYTTVRLDKGIPVVTEVGGFVQDDRKRVADIAKAAAQWYGEKRKTLSLTFKQVRRLFGLGWLITDIGVNYSPTPIRTPITAIEYVFPDKLVAPMTRVETGYAELDVR